MKRLLLLCSFFLTALAACKKDDDEIYIPPYHIDGITDLKMFKSAFGTPTTPHLELSVQYNNSVQERLALSLEGVPQGLRDSIIVPVGIPSFQTVVWFADDGVAEGTYPLTLVAQGEYSGRREFKFNFEVVGQPDCTAEIVGSNYNSYASCFGTSFTQSVTAVAGTKNRIVFSNVDGTGKTLYADVDCQNRGLRIPDQNINGIVYNGYGYYYAGSGQQQIQLTLMNNGPGVNYCNISMSL